MTRARPPHARESGSVIIWILVCVAMFAALSFTVSNMMRGGGTGVTEELVKVASSEIMAYSENIRRSIQVLRTAGGYTLPEISFQNDLNSGYENPRCGGPECRVFNSRGGGVIYAAPQADWLDQNMDSEVYFGEWYFAADICVPDVGTGGTDCAAESPGTNDLTLVLPYIKKNICVEINRQLGIENPNGNPPQQSGCPWGTATQNRYTGAFVAGQSIQSGTHFVGRQSGCFRMGICGTLEDNSYHYYQVLVAR